MEKKPLVFCGRASFKLAGNICDLLHVTLGDLDVMGYADGEPWYQVLDTSQITGRHVVMIQSTPEFAPKTYFDLWGPMWAIKKYKPRRFTVVMPFMGFRRQERDKDGGEAVMAEMVAQFTVEAGATDVVLCDPHAPVLVDYFETAGARVKVVNANQLYSELLTHRSLVNHKVYSADPGRKNEANELAEILGLGRLVGEKLRYDIDQSKAEGFDGDATGQFVIIREDEISTGGTIINSCKELKAAGAVGAIILATHPVFAAGSVQKLKKIDFVTEIITTDTVYLPWEKRIKKIKIVSIAPLLAKAVMEIHQS